MNNEFQNRFVKFDRLFYFNFIDINNPRIAIKILFSSSILFVAAKQALLRNRIRSQAVVKITCFECRNGTLGFGRTIINSGRYDEVSQPRLFHRGFPGILGGHSFSTISGAVPLLVR